MDREGPTGQEKLVGSVSRSQARSRARAREEAKSVQATFQVVDSGTASPMTIFYALEQLFTDQEHDLVADTIAPVLAWVPGKKRAAQPFVFQLEHKLSRAPAAIAEIHLTWDVSKLQARIPDVAAHAKRLASGASAQREHVPELAAYGLAFVAISVFMPGVRVLAFRKGLPPDLLFDVSPAALKGVEVAGRSTGGMRSLGRVREGTPQTARKAATLGKAAQLAARADVAEAHISLWCASPRVAIQQQVKP